MDDEDKYIRITLRIPKVLHGKLNAEAEASSKSLNAEIVARLNESFALAKKLRDLNGEVLGWRASVQEYAAKERQRLADESKQVRGDIDKHVDLIRKADYAMLKLRDVSHVLDLLLPITLDLASHLPEKTKQKAIYSSSIRLAETMVGEVKGSLAETVHQFLNGSLDATAAGAIRRAFEYLDEMVSAISAPEGNVPSKLNRR